jgi:transcriptional regulator
LVSGLVGNERAETRLSPDSFLSQLADSMVAVQLNAGAEVLSHSRTLLAEANATAAELRYAASRLAECLADALSDPVARRHHRPLEVALGVRALAHGLHHRETSFPDH